MVMQYLVYVIVQLQAIGLFNYQWTFFAVIVRKYKYIKKSNFTSHSQNLSFQICINLRYNLPLYFATRSRFDALQKKSQFLAR